MVEWLKRQLFSKDLVRLEEQDRAFKYRQNLLELREKDVERERASFDVTDLVREQLAGYNPLELDADGAILDLPELVGEEGGAEAFLAKVHDLANNTALDIILRFLTREQVLITAKEAGDMASINFGRASINGLTLLREEVERLDAVYVEKHAPPEPFNEHGAL